MQVADFIRSQVFLRTAYFWKETAAYLYKEMARPAGLEPATVGLEDAFSGYNSVYPRIVTPVQPAIMY